MQLSLRCQQNLLNNLMCHPVCTVQSANKVNVFPRKMDHMCWGWVPQWMNVRLRPSTSSTTRNSPRSSSTRRYSASSATWTPSSSANLRVWRRWRLRQVCLIYSISTSIHYSDTLISTLNLPKNFLFYNSFLLRRWIPPSRAGPRPTGRRRRSRSTWCSVWGWVIHEKITPWPLQLELFFY